MDFVLFHQCENLECVRDANHPCNEVDCGDDEVCELVFPTWQPSGYPHCVDPTGPCADNPCADEEENIFCHRDGPNDYNCYGGNKRVDRIGRQ